MGGSARGTPSWTYGFQKRSSPARGPSRTAPVEIEEAHVVEHDPRPDSRPEKAKPGHAQRGEQGEAVGEEGQGVEAEAGGLLPADLVQGLQGRSRSSSLRKLSSLRKYSAESRRPRTVEALS